MRKYIKNVRAKKYHVSYQFKTDNNNGVGSCDVIVKTKYNLRPKIKPNEIIEQLKDIEDFKSVILISWQEI